MAIYKAGMTDNSSMMGEEDTVIRMHVVDLAPVLREAASLSDFLQRTEGLWSTISEEMESEETLWVFAQNEYRDGRCWPAAMAVADYARDEADLTLKNTITRHQEFTGGGDLHNAYEEILFFVKDKRSYRFNKDPIRIAHVYEGNEWGGEREKGSSAYHDTEVRRYNPEGKDPGNVWLDEIRDETLDQTVDETHPLPRVEALKRCIRAGSVEGETIHIWPENDSFQGLVNAENRMANLRSFDSIGKA